MNTPARKALATTLAAALLLVLFPRWTYEGAMRTYDSRLPDTYNRALADGTPAPHRAWIGSERAGESPTLVRWEYGGSSPSTVSWNRRIDWPGTLPPVGIVLLVGGIAALLVGGQKRA